MTTSPTLGGTRTDDVSNKSKAVPPSPDGHVTVPASSGLMGQRGKGGAGKQKLFNCTQRQRETLDYTPQNIPASGNAVVN